MMVVFFVLFYGTFRFMVEFVREPDAQIGLLLGYLTMGQVLCLGMIVSAGLLALLLPVTGQAVPKIDRPGAKR
jgi:phosphatidylglycerol:prolipoprotein diacylglycerol transferase